VRNTKTCISDDLDDVWIEKVLPRLDGMGGSTHRAVGATDQERCHRINQAWIDQWFVPLYIDHNVVTGQAQHFAGLGQSVAAAAVTRVGENALHMGFVASLHDRRVIGGHHHLLRLTEPGAFGHPHDHRLTM